MNKRRKLALVAAGVLCICVLGAGRPSCADTEERPRRSLVVLDAPSNLGLRPPAPGRAPGAAKLAQAMRARGLLAHLGAADAGAVLPPAYRHEPDAASWFRNGTGLAEYSGRLADRVASLVGEERFVVLLGGDCSVLIGSMLGLRSLGRYGLVFIDGHDDFSPPRRIEEYRGRGAAAGLDLAVVTGHAPGDLGGLRGLGPYVREEDVVVFGYQRSAGDLGYATERLAATAIHAFDTAAIRAAGAAAAARAALAALDARAGGRLDGLWIHLDADVLDAAVMPAVDSPSPGGLSFEELGQALGVFLADPRVVGLQLTIYDPERDPTGMAGDRLAATLAGAFGALSRATNAAAPAGGGPAEVDLAPGAPGVDGRRIPAYRNLFHVFEQRPGTPERRIGSWEDEVDFVERDGRQVLRRRQRAVRGERTSTHLDEVDRETLAPLLARYESNGVLVAESRYDGARLVGRELAPPRMAPGGEPAAVGFTVELPHPVFDWHLWGVLLASLPLGDGFRASFLAHTTSDVDAPLLRRIAFRVTGREPVRRSAGETVECFVVEVDAGAPWTFWIPTDRRPVPVVQLRIVSPDGTVLWWRPPAVGDAPAAAE